MTVKELIEALSKYNLESQVMILDSFNGGGYLRTINLGPVEKQVTQEMAEECADSEEFEGELVIALGYGCY
jgi:hypothetical protein